MARIRSILEDLTLFFTWAAPPAFMNSGANPSDGVPIFPMASNGIQRDEAGTTTFNGAPLANVPANELRAAFNKALAYEQQAAKNHSGAMAVVNDPRATDADKKRYIRYAAIYQAQQDKRAYDRAEIGRALGGA